MRWASGYPPAFGSETHGEPHPLDTIRLGGRYADYFVEQSTRAQAIVDLLDAVPTALWLVRGLDVASDELSVPTWVLVPLYRYVLWRPGRSIHGALEANGAEEGGRAPQ
jgi:hypothetical protein